MEPLTNLPFVQLQELFNKKNSNRDFYIAAKKKLLAGFEVMQPHPKGGYLLINGFTLVTPKSFNMIHQALNPGSNMFYFDLLIPVFADDLFEVLTPTACEFHPHQKKFSKGNYKIRLKQGGALREQAEKLIVDYETQKTILLEDLTNHFKDFLLANCTPKSQALYFWVHELWDKATHIPKISCFTSPHEMSLFIKTLPTLNLEHNDLVELNEICMNLKNFHLYPDLKEVYQVAREQMVVIKENQISVLAGL